MKIDSKIFGDIDVSCKEGAYISEKNISNDSRNSKCSLFIGAGFESTEQINKISDLLNDIYELDNFARKKLLNEIQKNNTVLQEYIDFHIEETYGEVADKLGLSNVDNNAFINGLDLCGVGVHINSEKTISLNCDYCIGKDFTHELLVVRFNEIKEITEIAHES